MGLKNDYAYLVGSEYVDDIENGFYIAQFFDMCKERNKLVREYKALMNLKRKFSKDSIREDYKEAYYNSDYNKDMGYLYMRHIFDLERSNPPLAISKYSYCLAHVINGDSYLNHKIHVLNEEIAFLNANIKAIKPHVRAYKLRHEIKNT